MNFVEGAELRKVTHAKLRSLRTTSPNQYEFL